MTDKIGVIIQARLSSTRLPGKVLLDVEGKPLIQRQIERLCATLSNIPVIVATSTDMSDDKLAKFCQNNDITCFRGPLDDVIMRFILCARKVGLSHIVRVGGDDPLIDPDCCTALIDSHKVDPADFIFASHREGWPYGCAAELFSLDSLEKIHLATKDAFYLEHTIPYFFDHPNDFNIRKLRAPEHLRRPELAFTVDFPEDIELIRTVFRELKAEGDFFPLEQVIELVENNPKISGINSRLHSGFDH